MRRLLVSQILIACALFALTASAAVPQRLTYSGHLEEGGVPSEASVNFLFELYDAETGGALVWSESFVGVEVTDGLFTVELGATTALTPVLDGNVYWLEVSINGGAGLLPRTPFNSVPYAFKAADADTLGGQTATDIQTGTTPGAGSVTYDNTSSGLTSTDMQSVIDELLARIAALETENTSQQTAIDANTSGVAANASNITANASNITTNTSNITANAVDIAGNATDIAGNTTNISTNTSAIATNTTNIATNAGDIFDLQTLTAPMTLVGNDFYFTGVNVNVVSGSGSTAGTINGLGNLIVGYDEARTTDSDKSGSHNLVVGPEHNYTSYGGLVAGFQSTVTGIYSSVSGGESNTASGDYSSISGGSENEALGYYSSISGGIQNECVADSYWTWIGGGGFNQSDGGSVGLNPGGSVSGGVLNFASGWFSSVSGGVDNTASGDYSSVSGGSSNTASGDYSSVSGGSSNTASEMYSSVSGGRSNLASNFYSSVGGGYSNIASGNTSSVSGGYSNTASGNYSSVSGGRGNTASGLYSSISGGYYNATEATSYYTWIGGGESNTAGGGDIDDPGGSCVGGGANTSTGLWSSTTGGYHLTASGQGASVSGGHTRSATGSFDWAAGAYWQEQ